MAATSFGSSQWSRASIWIGQPEKSDDPYGLHPRDLSADVTPQQFHRTDRLATATIRPPEVTSLGFSCPRTRPPLHAAVSRSSITDFGHRAATQVEGDLR